MSNFFARICAAMLVSVTAAVPAKAGPGAAQAAPNVTNNPPAPPAQGNGWQPPTSQDEFCKAMAKCQQPAGNSPAKDEPIRAAQYVCEGPKWDEPQEVNGQTTMVHKTSGPHNKVPGQLGTVCVCDHPDFYPVAVHGTGRVTQSNDKLVVTQYTVMCTPKTSHYKSLFSSIEKHLQQQETKQADDEGFKEFVRRDLEEHGGTLIDHGKQLSDLQKWREKKDAEDAHRDCTLYGTGPNCKEKGHEPRIGALEARGVGLALDGGLFLLATPGGRMGGGMVSGIARYQPGKVGVEAELRGFFAPESLTSGTSYRGNHPSSIMGGGAAAHLTLSLFDDPKTRILLGSGVSVMSRTFKGPNDQARQGVTINIVELGMDIPLGKGVNLRPMVAPTYGWYGKADGVDKGMGFFGALSAGFSW